MTSGPFPTGRSACANRLMEKSRARIDRRRSALPTSGRPAERWDRNAAGRRRITRWRSGPPGGVPNETHAPRGRPRKNATVSATLKCFAVGRAASLCVFRRGRRVLASGLGVYARAAGLRPGCPEVVGRGPAVTGGTWRETCPGPRTGCRRSRATGTVAGLDRMDPFYRRHRRRWPDPKPPRARAFLQPRAGRCGPAAPIAPVGFRRSACGRVPARVADPPLEARA